MNYKNENLERLLRQFVDQAQAHQAAGDIEHADDIFDTNPAPSVSRETISQVKQKVQYQLEHAERIHSKIKWLSAAAVVAILLTGLLVLHSNTENFSETPIHIAQNKIIRPGDFDAADVSTTEIENEITRLLEAVENIGADPYEPVNTLQLNLTELENELMADSTEFWKG